MWFNIKKVLFKDQAKNTNYSLTPEQAEKNGYFGNTPKGIAYFIRDKKPEFEPIPEE